MTSAKPDEEDVPIGKLFGPWRVVALIGRGGYASVYKCQHRLQSERFAAVKALLPAKNAKPDSQDRFLLEIQIQTKLKNPNVVQVYDADMMPDGTVWMAMELLEGKTLDQLIDERRRVNVVDGLKIMADIADGIQAAHDLGVVHRDLKPLNVFITTSGVVKILDHGVAKLVDKRLAAKMKTTDEHKVPGSLPYMSPEQVSGKPVDYRSDIFSFGVVAFQVFTGMYPFADEDGRIPAEAVTLIGRLLMQGAPAPRDPRVGRQEARRGPPERGDALWEGVPYSVWLMVRRALEKNPSDRFQSMAEAKKEIIRLLAGHLMDEDLPERPLMSGTPNPVRRQGPALAIVPPATASVAKPEPSMTPATPPSANDIKDHDGPCAVAGGRIVRPLSTEPMPHVSRTALSNTPPTPSSSPHAPAAGAAPRFVGRHGTVPMAQVPSEMQPRQAPARGRQGTVPMPHETPKPSQAARRDAPRASSLRAAGVVALVTLVTAILGVAGIRLLRAPSAQPAVAEPASSSSAQAAKTNLPGPAADPAPLVVPGPTADASRAPAQLTATARNSAAPVVASASTTEGTLLPPAIPAPVSTVAPVSSASRRLGLPYETPKPPPNDGPKPLLDRW